MEYTYEMKAATPNDVFFIWCAGSEER